MWTLLALLLLAAGRGLRIGAGRLVVVIIVDIIDVRIGRDVGRVFVLLVRHRWRCCRSDDDWKRRANLVGLIAKLDECEDAHFTVIPAQRDTLAKDIIRDNLLFAF